MSYSSASTIRLVTAREINVALRSKSFIISFVIMLIVTIGGLAAAAYFSSDDDASADNSNPAAHVLAVSGVDPTIFSATPAPENTETNTAAEGTSAAPSGTAPAAVNAHKVDSRKAAEQAVRSEADDKADAALVAVGNNHYELLSDGTPDPSILATVQQALQTEAHTTALRDIGADPTAYDRALPPVDIKGIDLSASGEQDEEDSISPAVFALVPGITWIMFLVMMFSAQTGGRVTEEKSSRVVEILLATVRTSDLLAGKIIGNVLVGLLFSLAFVLTGGVGLAVTGLAQDINFNWTALPILLAIYLLGSLFFSSLYAAAGALVSRTEDLQSTGLPIMMLLVGIIYSTGFGIPYLDSTFMTVLTWVPPFSITVAPMQYIAGNLPLPLFLATYALVVVAILGAIALTARVYRNAILRNGTKVKWREALK